MDPLKISDLQKIFTRITGAYFSRDFFSTASHNTGQFQAISSCRGAGHDDDKDNDDGDDDDEDDGGDDDDDDDDDDEFTREAGHQPATPPAVLGWTVQVQV